MIYNKSIPKVDSLMVTTIPLQVPQTLRVTEAQFLEFVKANPELRLERTDTGELIAMTPTGSESGHYNAELTGDFVVWNRQQATGKIFDSSSGFRLPNGAIRSPDLAWVSRDRWDALTVEEQKGFAPLCPDFVIELVSETDDLPPLQAKMREYQENGCRLGWLIIPKTRTVEIYRKQGAPEVVPFTTCLSGEDVLPGFQLDLQSVFTPSPAPPEA